MHRAPGIPHALVSFRANISGTPRAQPRRGNAKSCLLNMNVPNFQSSSPAHAGDPVFRGVSDGIERPQRTGYPACAEYDGRERSNVRATICARANARHLSPCGRGRIASTDAIRVRGCALSRDLDPSPQPSPTRGEGGLTAFAATPMFHFESRQKERGWPGTGERARGRPLDGYARP